jgi:hypothetical protein
MDMASLAATRLTANAEALAAFYEARDVLRRAGARGELERPQRRYDPQPRWAAQAQYFSGLYREVRCLAPRGHDAAVDDVSDDGVGTTRVLADDEVRFEPHPHVQKRYDPIDMQPRLELLFEEALVPHRDRDLFLSEWKRGRVDDQALSNEIKGLVRRRAHLREIMAALRAARAAAPPLSIPDVEAPPNALVEAEPSTHVAGVLDPSRSRFFPRAPPLPNCVPVKRKERRLGVSAKFT